MGRRRPGTKADGSKPGANERSESEVHHGQCKCGRLITLR